jgi:hypothetical protein
MGSRPAAADNASRLERLLTPTADRVQTDVLFETAPFGQRRRSKMMTTVNARVRPQELQAPMIRAVRLKQLCGLALLAITIGFAAQAAEDETLGKVTSGRSSPSSAEFFSGPSDNTITLFTSCGGADHLIAVTNKVSTTIKSPNNVGDCSFDLQCRKNAGARSSVGFSVTFPPRTAAHSFSCGTDAVGIYLIGQGAGTAGIEYVP